MCIYIFKMLKILDYTSSANDGSGDGDGGDGCGGGGGGCSLCAK